MATFNSMIVTNGGKIIYAKALSGKTITFSKVEFGSGMPASQSDAEKLSALIDSKIIGSIESIDTTTREGVAIITAQVNNENLTAAIGIKEIGIFVEDPDTSADVLYSYAYSPTDIDVIPSNENGSIIWKMRVQLAISNATGSATEQSALVSYTPTVAATAADGITVFVSEILASCSYVTKGNVTTAFYNITGKLSNMDKAADGLSSLTISLPKQSAIQATVAAEMTVIDSENTAVLVGISGVIAKDGLVIDLDYFGAQSGDFSLNMTVEYTSK